MTRPASEPLRHPARLSLLLCVFLTLLPAPLPAQVTQNKISPWVLLKQSEPEVLSPGIFYIKKTIATEDDPIKTSESLHLVFFNTEVATLKLIDQGNDKSAPRYGNIAEAMQDHFCIAGTNGGYFSPGFSPSGMLIADGVRTGSFSTRSSLLTGALVVEQGHGPRLLWKDEVKLHDGITQLVQAGPRLVIDGQSYPAWKTSPERNRSFIATDRANQNWCIGLATGLPLHDMSLVLATPEVMHEFPVWRALNLDGGTSSSIYFNRGAGRKPFHFRGFKAAVQNFLGIAPKEN